MIITLNFTMEMYYLLIHGLKILIILTKEYGKIL